MRRGVTLYVGIDRKSLDHLTSFQYGRERSGEWHRFRRKQLNARLPTRRHYQKWTFRRPAKCSALG